MKLELVEDEVISIYENDYNEKLVNARDLHKMLGSKRQFANWIKSRIDQYNFIENEDYFTFNIFVKRGESNLGTTLIEYYLTMNTAKEMAMIENNEMGRKIRKYFIEVEKRYQMIFSSAKDVNGLLQIIKVALKYNEEKFEIIDRKFEEIDEQIQTIKITIKKICDEGENNI